MNATARATPHGVALWLPAVDAATGSVRVLEPAREGGPEAVRRAWESLPPGTTLVLHDPGDAPRPRHRGPLHACVAAVAGARVERLLVLPGTGGSHVLLGAAPRAALAGALDLLPQGRARWRALRRALGPVARLGGLDHLGLGELWVVRPRRSDETPRHLSVVRGVEGATRKSVVRVADERGRVLRYVKVADGPESGVALRREAAALELLERNAPGLAPRLLGFHGDGEGCWLVQSPLSGKRSTDTPGRPHVLFLAHLQRSTGCAATLRELPVHRHAAEGLERLAGRVDAAWLDTFRGLARALPEALPGSLPCQLAHGDFTPWNLLVEDGVLRAFDWEFAQERATPLFDLAHFVLQTGVLVRHRAAPELLREFLELARGSFASLTVGLDPHALLGVCLLHQAVQDERRNQVERPSFAQVDWLRNARLDLARLLLERLPRTARRGVAA